MRLFKLWSRNGKVDPLPTEEEGREARAKAETAFRQTTEKWAEIHEVSKLVESARKKAGPDPFVEELARAMRARQKHREA